MKTTLDLQDELLSEAKARAARAGMTLRAFVEDALRAHMIPTVSADQAFKLELPVVTGRRPPAVDVADRRQLYDYLDDHR
jgi:hypothetical protein